MSLRGRVARLPSRPSRTSCACSPLRRATQRLSPSACPSTLLRACASRGSSRESTMRAAYGGLCRRFWTRLRSSTGCSRTFTLTRMHHLHRAARGPARPMAPTECTDCNQTTRTLHPPRSSYIRRLLVWGLTALFVDMWAKGGCPTLMQLLRCGQTRSRARLTESYAFGRKLVGDGSYKL